MNSTFPKGEVFTPTDTVHGQFNTFDPATGLLITLAGSPSLRLERLRTNAWVEITGDGITLDEDADHDSAGVRTGRHSGAFDLDDANIAAQSGDRYDIVLHAGTVDGDSMAHVLLGWFYVQTDGLTTAQKADIIAQLKAAMGVITGAVAVNAGNTAASFEVDGDADGIKRFGRLVFTSDNLDTEARPVIWDDVQVDVWAPDSPAAGLGDAAAFSAEPDEGSTFEFWPIT